MVLSSKRKNRVKSIKRGGSITSLSQSVNSVNSPSTLERNDNSISEGLIFPDKCTPCLSTTELGLNSSKKGEGEGECSEKLYNECQMGELLSSIKISGTEFGRIIENNTLKGIRRILENSTRRIIKLKDAETALDLLGMNDVSDPLGQIFGNLLQILKNEGINVKNKLKELRDGSNNECNEILNAFSFDTSRLNGENGFEKLKNFIIEQGENAVSMCKLFMYYEAMKLKKIMENNRDVINNTLGIPSFPELPSEFEEFVNKLIEGLNSEINELHNKKSQRGGGGSASNSEEEGEGTALNNENTFRPKNEFEVAVIAVVNGDIANAAAEGAANETLMQVTEFETNTLNKPSYTSLLWDMLYKFVYACFIIIILYSLLSIGVEAYTNGLNITAEVQKDLYDKAKPSDDSYMSYIWSATSMIADTASSAAKASTDVAAGQVLNFAHLVLSFIIAFIALAFGKSGIDYGKQFKRISNVKKESKSEEETQKALVRAITAGQNKKRAILVDHLRSNLSQVNSAVQQMMQLINQQKRAETRMIDQEIAGLKQKLALTQGTNSSDTESTALATQQPSIELQIAELQQRRDNINSGSGTYHEFESAFQSATNKAFQNLILNNDQYFKTFKNTILDNPEKWMPDDKPVTTLRNYRKLRTYEEKEVEAIKIIGEAAMNGTSTKFERYVAGHLFEIQQKFLLTTAEAMLKEPDGLNEDQREQFKANKARIINQITSVTRNAISAAEDRFINEFNAVDIKNKCKEEVERFVSLLAMKNMVGIEKIYENFRTYETMSYFGTIVNNYMAASGVVGYATSNSFVGMGSVVYLASVPLLQAALGLGGAAYVATLFAKYSLAQLKQIEKKTYEDPQKTIVNGFKYYLIQDIITKLKNEWQTRLTNEKSKLKIETLKDDIIKDLEQLKIDLTQDVTMSDQVAIHAEMRKSKIEFDYTKQQDLLFNIVKTVLENVESLLEKKEFINNRLDFAQITRAALANQTPLSFGQQPLALTNGGTTGASVASGAFGGAIKKTKNKRRRRNRSSKKNKSSILNKSQRSKKGKMALRYRKKSKLL